MSRAIDKAREYIQNADAVLITAGAGMGVIVDYLILGETRDFGKPILLLQN
jgi:hypothetical protein